MITLRMMMIMTVKRNLGLTAMIMYKVHTLPTSHHYMYKDVDTKRKKNA